eukprot:3627208-Pyramimonas_sp.AAC.1
MRTEYDNNCRPFLKGTFTFERPQATEKKCGVPSCILPRISHPIRSLSSPSILAAGSSSRRPFACIPPHTPPSSPIGLDNAPHPALAPLATPVELDQGPHFRGRWERAGILRQKKRETR